MKRAWFVGFAVFLISSIICLGNSLNAAETLHTGEYDKIKNYSWETSIHPRPIQPDHDAQTVDMRMEKSASPAVKEGMLVASLAYPTGKKDTSSLWLEKHYPASVRLGQPYKYFIKVTNLTSLALENVLINETIPAGFKVISIDPPSSESAGDKYVWNLGTLSGNAKRTITVEGLVGGKGELPCCTSASFVNPALCVTPVVVQPSLKVDLNVEPSALVCDEIPAEFTVTNTGDVVLSNVIIKSMLPDGLMTDKGNNTVMINAGSLPAGASKSFSAMLKAGRVGTFQFDATAASDDISAKSSVERTTVFQPELTITASASRSKQFVGRDVSYNVQVKNVGNVFARNAMVEAKVGNAQVESASEGGQVSGNVVKWDLKDIASGASSALMSVNVLAQDAGVSTLDAMVKAYCTDPARAIASAEISGIPAILLEVVDVEDPVEVGGMETYVIKVTNQGSAKDTNISVVAVLEDMEYVESSGETQGSVSGNKVTFAPLSSLGPKDSAEWRVHVKGSKTGDLRFKTILTSDQLTRPVEETEATNVY